MRFQALHVKWWNKFSKTFFEQFCEDREDSSQLSNMHKVEVFISNIRRYSLQQKKSPKFKVEILFYKGKYKDWYKGKDKENNIGKDNNKDMDKEKNKDTVEEKDNAKGQGQGKVQLQGQ